LAFVDIFLMDKLSAKENEYS